MNEQCPRCKRFRFRARGNTRRTHGIIIGLIWMCSYHFRLTKRVCREMSPVSSTTLLLRNYTPHLIFKAGRLVLILSCISVIIVVIANYIAFDLSQIFCYVSLHGNHTETNVPSMNNSHPSDMKQKKTCPDQDHMKARRKRRQADLKSMMAANRDVCSCFALCFFVSLR